MLAGVAVEQFLEELLEQVAQAVAVLEQMPIRIQQELLERPTQAEVVEALDTPLLPVGREVQAAQVSSSSNTLVVPQQALQSSQDRPHGLPRPA